MSRKKVISLVLLILAILLFVISATLLILHFIPEKNDYDSYKKKTVSSDPKANLPDNPIDFAALQAKNADVCAWITVKDTPIDYPILRSGADTEEDFYLTHDLDRNPSHDACVYIQRINSGDFTDSNTVIYGHDLADGTMFTPLRKFRSAQHFNDHPTIYIYTPGHIKTYTIFSAFVYDNRHILNSFRCHTPEGFSDFLAECRNPTSLSRNLRPEIPVSTDDTVITLSTCTNVPTERYLVVAVQVDDVQTK